MNLFPYKAFPLFAVVTLLVLGFVVLFGMQFDRMGHGDCAFMGICSLFGDHLSFWQGAFRSPVAQSFDLTAIWSVLAVLLVSLPLIADRFPIHLARTISRPPDRTRDYQAAFLAAGILHPKTFGVPGFSS